MMIVRVEDIDVRTLLIPPLNMIRILLYMPLSLTFHDDLLKRLIFDQLGSLSATSSCNSVQVDSLVSSPRRMKCPSVKHGRSSSVFLNDCVLFPWAWHGHFITTILLMKYFN